MIMKKIFLLFFLVGFISVSSATTYTLSSSLGIITTCSGTFVDGGGSGSDYASSSNYTVTFCSGSSANVVISFSSFNVESGYDHLLIYDGSSTAATLIDNVTGNVGAFVVQSSGSCITFNFTSDISTTAAGWAATISCTVPCTPPTAGGIFTNQTAPVKVCTGEAINFSGASSAAGGGFSIVSYLWNFDDGTTGTGVTTSHSYSTPGQYVVNLDVTDNNSCTSINNIDLVIQVSTTPTFTGTTPNQTVCAGQNVCLNGVVNPTTWTDISPTTIAGTTFLPDGNGVCYTTSLNFTEFLAGQTLSNISQLQSICANMEHSFLGDLTISIICPNMTTVDMHGNGAGVYDGTFLGVPIDDGSITPGIGYDYCWSPTATNGTMFDNTGGTLPAGTYESQNPLTALVGCPMNGDWTIEVCDNLASDNGYIFSWQINFDPSVYSAVATFTPTFNANCTYTYWAGANGASTSAISSTSANCDQICVTPPTAGTYTYVYTGIDNFGCTYSTTTTVTATPGPTVTVNSPTICSGATATLTASGATTYSWSGGLGTGNPKTVSPASGITYTVTGTTAGCAGTANATVTVNPNVTPTFTALGPYCVGATPGTLPTTSTNSITGTWSPSAISTASAGTTVYTFTPTAGQCATTKTMSVIVNANVPPTFTALGPYCIGATPGTLPTTSTNSITGTWSPSTISTASAGTTVYTFTPTVGLCATTTTMSVVVGTNITPTFTALGPYCVGVTPGALPTTSTNGITGTWNAAINTASAGTAVYTFTPTVGQCALSTTMNITVNPNPTAVLSGSATICSGASTNLQVALTGTAPWSFTYNDGTNHTIILNSSPATISVNPASTTTFTTVSISDANCSGTASGSATITVNPAIAISNVNTTCNGPNTQYQVTFNITGGNAATYSVTPAGTITAGSPYTFTSNWITSGTAYSFSVTDTYNCNPQLTGGTVSCACPATGTISGNATICAGSSTNLSFTLTGTAPWSIIYSDGTNSYPVNNINASPLTISVSPSNTTTYTLTSIADASCTGTANGSATVSVNQIPVVTATPLSQSFCNGGATSISLSSIVPGTTFAWSASASGSITGYSNGSGNLISQTLTNSGATSGTVTYIVIPTANTCVGSPINVVITVNPTPIANAGTDQIICIGQSANLTAFGGGTYLWSNTSPNQSTNVSPLTTTTYIVTVTLNGCTNTDDVTVNVNGLPTADAGLDQAICSGNTANLLATGGVSYAWSPTGSLTNPNMANPVASPSGTTTYSVTVTDGNGCSATDAMVLSVFSQLPANAGIDQTICNGQTANLLATGGSVYNWSPANGLTSSSIPNPGASPLTTTTYIVTVSDANGCSATDDITITVNAVPTSDFTLSSPICIGGTSSINYTGTASPLATYNWDFDSGTIGSGSGQGPYQISWSNPSTYNISLSVTENGCTSTSTIIPQIVGQVSVSLAVTDSITCNGAADGQVTATATGLSPYLYTWSNLQVVPIAINLSAAIPYSVTVTDANGCTASQSITLSQPQPLSMNFVSQNVSCNRGSNGVAVALVSGGTVPYAYGWTPAGIAGNVNTVTTLSAGTYSFAALDAHGCTIDTTFTITEPPALSYSYTTDSVNCYSGSDGSIDVITSGGSSPYAYTWSPIISTGPTVTGLQAGTYQLTITDHNGCDTTLSISVFQPPQLTLTNSGDVSICNGQSTTITAGATGGTGAYTFTWDNGLGNGNSFNVSPTTTTTYTVSIVDGNSCSVSPQSLTVSVSPPISVSLTSNPNAMCLGNSTVLTATANGGNGNYIYTWGQGIGVSTSAITVIPTGTTMYPVTVTDNCGSPQDVDSVQITIYPLPVVVFSSDAINGCEPLGINFTDNSTPAIASWLWNFGDPLSGGNNTSTSQNPGHLYAESGTYTVSLTVITSDGCSGSYTHQDMVEVYPTPVADFASAPAQTTILNPIIQFADMSSGASDWSWNFGDFATGSNNISSETSPSHYYSNPGNFNVTLIVTSNYGCIDSISKEIIIDLDFTFYAPNAFSPDGNGKNDFFFPQGEGWDLENYQLYIFDRWGEQIFKTNNANEYWDGRVNGSSLIAPQGVYVWAVYVRDLNGEPHTFDGRVTLLRK